MTFAVAVVVLLFSNSSSALTFDSVVILDCSKFQNKYFEVYNAIRQEPSKILTMGSALYDSAISYMNCNAQKTGSAADAKNLRNIRKDVAGNAALLYYHYLLTVEEASVRARLLSLADYIGDQVYFFTPKNPLSFVQTANPIEIQLLYLNFLSEIISTLESDSFGWVGGNLVEAKTMPGSAIVTYETYSDFREFMLKKFFKNLKLNPYTLSDLQQNSILLNSAMTTPFLIAKMEQTRMSRGDSAPFLAESDYDKALRKTADELGRQGDYLKAMQVLSLWLASFEHKSQYRGLTGIVKMDLNKYAYLESATVAQGLVQCFEGLASIEGIVVGAVLLLAPEVVATGAVVVFAGLMIGHSFQPFTDEYYGVESAASEKTVAGCNLAFAAVGAKYGFSKASTITKAPLKTPFYESLKKIREVLPQTTDFGLGSFEFSVKAPALQRLSSAVKSFGQRMQRSLCFMNLEKSVPETILSQTELQFAAPCIFSEIPLQKLTYSIPEVGNKVLKLQEKGGGFVIDLNKVTPIPKASPRPMAIKIIKLMQEKEGLYYEVEPMVGVGRFKIRKDTFEKYANYLEVKVTPEVYKNAVAKAEIALRQSVDKAVTERSVSAKDGLVYIRNGEITRIGSVSAAEENAVYVGLNYETTGSSGGQVPILKSGAYKGGYRGGYGATFEFDLNMETWLEKYDAALEFLPKKVPIYDQNGKFFYFREVRNEPWIRVTKNNKVQLQFMVKYANALRKYKADLLSRLEQEGKTPEEINVELNKFGKEVGVDHLTVQVVIKNKVPLSEVKRIRVDTEELRTLYISELKKAGINHLKNRPVEEAVFVEFR